MYSFLVGLVFVFGYMLLGMVLASRGRVPPEYRALANVVGAFAFIAFSGCCLVATISYLAR